MLTQQEINELKRDGLTDDEINRYIQEIQQSQQFQQNPNSNASFSPFSAGINQQDNLIRWQLELDDILERVEHMLRGDKIKIENGSKIYARPETNFERVFTDDGVEEIMRILSIYINRNTILSDFNEETILWKTLDFGKTFNRTIYFKYETLLAIPTIEECFQKVYNTKDKLIELEYKDYIIEHTNPDKSISYFSLTEEQYNNIMYEYKKQKAEKQKVYLMVVQQLVDIIFTAFNRAKDGGERQSLREARTVTESLSMQQNPYQPQPLMKEKQWWNPSSWGKRR